MPKGQCRGDCALWFSSTSAFDAHMDMRIEERYDKLAKKTVYLTTSICRPPDIVGLVEREGIWGHAAPEKPIVYNGTTEERKPWQGNCKSCGKTMGKKPGRGRPPANCTNCGGTGIPQ